MKVTKQTIVNKARKSRYKNALKRMNSLIEDKKKPEALKFLPKLNSELMKIAKSGIIKKQNASRNVSRISKKISSKKKPMKYSSNFYISNFLFHSTRDFFAGFPPTVR